MRWKKIVTALFISAALFLYQGVESMPRTLTMFLGEGHRLTSGIGISVAPEDAEKVATECESGLRGGIYTLTPHEAENFDCRISVLGIPCRNIHVEVKDNPTVMACGNAVGVKIYEDGLMIVEFTNIALSCPAADAGMEVGDVIVRVNGEPTLQSKTLSALLKKADGEEVTVEYLHDGELSETKLRPKKDSDGTYRIGAWVRSSIAGVGTLTFYQKDTGNFVSLGHSISDYDTGEAVSVSKGSLVPCRIEGIQKSVPGRAGELKGRFFGEEVIGVVEANTPQGITGKILTDKDLSTQEVHIGLKTQIHTGACTIRTTLSGNTVREYDAEVEKVLSLSGTRNMIVRMTDPELLAETGGIVQGMSGSPILQDGKLIGAVTHVFVDNPTEGYGISVENMMEPDKDQS